MKLLLCAIQVSFLVVWAGCGQMDGDNPVGVTGGGEDGYGSIERGASPEIPNAAMCQNSPLVGTWRHNQVQYSLLFEFSANCNASMHTCVQGDCETLNGTWQDMGEQIEITLDGSSLEFGYSLNDGSLLLDGDVYERVK